MATVPAASAVGAPDAALTGPLRAEIAASTGPRLREAVASCRACALCESRQQTVFGVGHPHAHWMIVGEAPGEQEDRQGEPFVGPAGQLLDNMLHAIGLTRDEAPPERQVFIANTLKCRPPKNRNPEPAETAQLRAVPRTPDRAGAAAHHPGDGPLRGAGAAGQHRAAGQAARPRTSLARRAGGRDLPPGLPAAHPGRQGPRLGRPVPGGNARGARLTR